MIPLPENPVRLGASALEAVPLAFGTWTWDNRGSYGKGPDYKEEDLREAFLVNLRNGIDLYDTAEAYGQGDIERLLGRFIREFSAQVKIAGKFPPFRGRFLKRHLVTSLHNSLKRLGRERFDLYQMHFHFRLVPLRVWTSALGEVYREGLVRAVGVCNYAAGQIRKAHSLLAQQGIPLAAAQAEYSLLHRSPEVDGVLTACKELGVTGLAYSPLGRGVLTGRFTSSSPPPGERGQRFDAEFLDKAQPLIGLLREIGRAHRGKTPAQVALNWVICKGAIPIHGAKNARQAEENCGALGWRLEEHEVRALDDASRGLQR